MRKTVEQYYCDVCKKQVKTKDDINEMTIPMVCNVTQDDGKLIEPYYVGKKLEVCYDCLDKIAVVKYGMRKVEGFR